MGEYILSIIIPTKNRYEYLIDSLKSIMDFDLTGIEIVIQDNSSSNKIFLDFMSSTSNNSLKYFYDKRSMPISENVDLAISNSTGEYICFIGDDDTITKNLIDTVKYMKSNKIDACNFEMSRFYWSDIEFSVSKKPYFEYIKTDKNIYQVKTKRVLMKYIKSGFQEIKMLPRIYHGILKKNVLEKIKYKTGSYNPGPSPDMANAVAASFFVQKQVFINYPLIVSGSSYKSAAGMGVRGKHKGDLKDFEHLPKDIERNWNENLPKIWLAHTIWPQSAIEALNKMGEEEYIRNINWNKIYARTVIKHREMFRVILKHHRKKFRIFRFIFYVIQDLSKYINKKLRLYILYIFKRQYRSFKPTTIQVASEMTSTYLDNCNYLEMLKKSERKIKK